VWPGGRCLPRMRLIAITLPRSPAPPATGSPGEPVAPLCKWYPAARRSRFACTGQIHAAAADGPAGPGSHQSGSRPQAAAAARQDRFELTHDDGQVPADCAVAQQSRWATSGLLNPCATSSSTPSSRGVSTVTASPDTATRACPAAVSVEPRRHLRQVEGEASGVESLGAHRRGAAAGGRGRPAGLYPSQAPAPPFPAPGQLASGHAAAAKTGARDRPSDRRPARCNRSARSLVTPPAGTVTPAPSCGSPVRCMHDDHTGPRPEQDQQQPERDGLPAAPGRERGHPAPALRRPGWRNF
jgi:hypothetical protein